MKYEIDSAIATASRVFENDYALYVYCLSDTEAIEEKEEVEEAFKVLEKYGITNEDVRKHNERINNVVPEPVPFINRPHPVETDELPF